MSATLYAKALGGNWSAATTWSSTSSAGVDNAGPPDATTNVVFDAGAITVVVVDTPTCVAQTLTCQGAANSITFTAGQNLAVGGNVTFFAGMTLTGTGTLEISNTSTMTSGGLTFPGALTFSSATTKTLAGDWAVTGMVTTSAATVLNKTTAETLTCAGGLTVNGNLSGTAAIVLTGGTWSVPGGHLMSNNLSFAGNVTVSGLIYYLTGTLTYTSGTITATGSTLSTQGNIGFNTAGMTWGIVSFDANGVVTLYSDLACATLRFSTGGGVITTMSGLFNITCDALVKAPATPTVTLKIVDGQTLTVNTSMSIVGSDPLSTTIQSKTATSKVYLNYLGTLANCDVHHMVFTDVDASGSSIPIPNMYGGTLTRTANIVNKTLADLGGSNIFGMVG